MSQIHSRLDRVISQSLEVGCAQGIWGITPEADCRCLSGGKPPRSQILQTQSAADGRIFQAV